MDLSARFFRIFFPPALFETSSDSIHLTFDDGPHPQATTAVLDVLRQSGIRATFFLTGERVVQFPELAKRIVEEGHTIGNHAYSHRAMIFASRKAIVKNIVDGNHAIKHATGVLPRLFRPPFGYYDLRMPGIVQSLGMKLVHWSHDVRDFARRPDNGSLGRISNSVTKGSILLLHDNDSTAQSINSYLPALIDLLKVRAYSFSPLP